MQYIVYTDESEKKGKFYGNFYGGALVRSIHFKYVVDMLQNKKEELNLNGEVKWQKVTENYLTKYIELINVFFDLIKDDLVKVRIMFSHNMRIATNLTKEQRDNEYFLLYYQFFKHIFGFPHSNPTKRPISLYFLMDQLPDTKEKNEKFKRYIHDLQYQEEFTEANLHFKSMDDIGEATSHEHIILQCLDVVLGSIEFRLNEKHTIIPEGKKRRGKRTVAKEKLYKVINKRIRETYPNFNIGESTGTMVYSDRWNHPYRHWKFAARNAEFNEQYKGKRK